MRTCTKHIENQIGERNAMNMLAENQSYSSYKRMRMSQSFETPEAKRARYDTNSPKPKKHSPNFANVTWDTDQLRHTLENWPQTETINWSKVANEAKNGGQIVKEFAAENGFDVTKLDKRTGIKRMRARKLRMPGGEISVPCHKTVENVKSDVQNMLLSGDLTLGEPCAPCKVTKYTLVDGKIEISEQEVHGRKIPLMYIRKKLLQKHEMYMRLHTDAEIEHMTTQEVVNILNKAQVTFSDDMDDDALKTPNQKIRNNSYPRNLARSFYFIGKRICHGNCESHV